MERGLSRGDGRKGRGEGWGPQHPRTERRRARSAHSDELLGGARAFRGGRIPWREGPAGGCREAADAVRGGIDYFIDLTEPGEWTPSGELVPYAEAAEEEARGLRLTIGLERRPIADLGLPRSPEQMAVILDAIDAAMDGGRTVYLHCRGGVGRTGTVVGCWLVRHGYSGDGALAQVAAWWEGVEKDYPRSPDTWEQHEYVRGWAEAGAEGRGR